MTISIILSALRSLAWINTILITDYLRFQIDEVQLFTIYEVRSTKYD